MTSRTQREKLNALLVDTRRMQALSGGHPLMAGAFAEREEELKAQIESIPLGGKEARTILFFSGEPVQGSQGIDASFAGRVLEPFQSMVMADYADRYHGVVGSRGRRVGEADSRLLLTGLPRGSFGLELSKAENDEIFEEDQLADTLSHVSRLVESAAESDEDFAAELNDTAPRVIQNLRSFLEVVARGKAGLRLESGDYRCTMNPIQASEAFERVNSTISNPETVEKTGIFKGVLLESWRFDFMTDDAHKISGKIDDELSAEQVANLNREFFDRQCKAVFEETTVLFRNGRKRTTYILKGLSEVS
ncbi:hypothetical protein [Roseibacillus persicicus]|uniref:Uncharacterized protein n=1 Tax=Roseibacillus persicicus TaxID=454148 RepID=A0A918TML5_9BACT|nr:hypothetical protein [Roseibacillus persicicus]GHC54359.1 hypothetical protein GCM10007100_20950 [Roseibacillus persicicus]